ncbi:Jag family protein [Desulfogranum japonicum]|uniref:Jag family protein n=1 Tax=Desulfogranum japonicum TaxID=231447 RepID=UPI0004252EC9|nr:protein jag [Desulfogranum japonicum]
MTKGKDFFGKDITDVIEQACSTFQTTQDELDIEVLETGSAGIFGLCKKQAHIRVTRKPCSEGESEPVKETSNTAAPSGSDKVEETLPAENDQSGEIEKVQETLSSAPENTELPEEPSVSGKSDSDQGNEIPEETDVEQVTIPVPPYGRNTMEVVEVQPPSQDVLDSIQETLSQLLGHMQCPGTVDVQFVTNTVECQITSEYETDIIGPDGRTLDSLQYLLRKMIARQLPDRALLAVNVGEFREKRAEELKQKAVKLAALVKEDGKTQAIPALNPSERRIVHIALQDDKSVRSRSVGDGLFKKVLIYKPGKSRRGPGKKKRGQHGNRRSND